MQARWIALVAVAAVASGCAESTWSSTVTLRQTVQIRVPWTEDVPEAGECVRACGQPNRGGFGECLSRCPRHELLPGECPAEAQPTTVCANRVMQWTSTRAGRCAQVARALEPGEHLLRCEESERSGDDWHVGLAWVGVLGLAALYGLGYLLEHSAHIE